MALFFTTETRRARRTRRTAGTHLAQNRQLAFRFAGSALSPYVFLPLYNTDPSRAFVACAVAACVIVPLAIAIRTLSAEPVPRPATEYPLLP